MAWLLCDYGEVLSTAPPPADRAALLAAAAWDPADGDFWEIYWAGRPSYDRADVTAREYWTAVLGRAPEDHRLAELIRRDAAGWLHPNEETLAAVSALGARGVRLAVLSNAPVEVAAEIDAAPWLADFTPRLFSCDLRAIKPDPRAYRAALDALGAAPDEVVFVDDRPANVEGARAVGMRAEVFTGPGALAGIARDLA